MTTSEYGAAMATTNLLQALRRAHEVSTPTTGAVIVDGAEIASREWDIMAMGWDGTSDGLRDLGYDAAADAMDDVET